VHCLSFRLCPVLGVVIPPFTGVLLLSPWVPDLDEFDNLSVKIEFMASKSSVSVAASNAIGALLVVAATEVRTCSHDVGLNIVRLE
jgi:hypothetical protein